MNAHRLNPYFRSILLLLLGLGVPGRRVVAQTSSRNSGLITATATVVATHVAATSLRRLDFGAVRTDMATTLQPTDAGAGEWRVVGNANALIAIDLTLPAELANVHVPSVSPLPIAFTSKAGRWRQAVDDAAGAAAFDPKVGATARFGPGPNPALYIWIGGTLPPAVAGVRGAFQGTVTLTVSYL